MREKLDGSAEGNVVGIIGRQGRDATLDVPECAAIRWLSSSEVAADSYSEIAISKVIRAERLVRVRV